MYQLSYQYNMDIDWFYVDHGFPVHAASNGGHLDHYLCSVPDLKKIQSLVSSMEPLYDVELNTEAILANVSELYSEDTNGELYASLYDGLEDGVVALVKGYGDLPKWMPLYCNSFVQMARRGFFSFDRNEETDEYFLVCAPKMSPEDLYYKKEYQEVLSFIPGYDQHQDIPQKFASQIEAFICARTNRG